MRLELFVRSAVVASSLILAGTVEIDAAEPVLTLTQQLLQEDIGRWRRLPASMAIRTAGRWSSIAMIWHARVATRPANNRFGWAPISPRRTRSATDVYLIESVLLPSKVIKKGFETITITTTDGKTISGLLAADRSDAVVLRDTAQIGN